MFCTRTCSCARADDAKSCAVGMRNAILENYRKYFFAFCYVSSGVSYNVSPSIPIEHPLFCRLVRSAVLLTALSSSKNDGTPVVRIKTL